MRTRRGAAFPQLGGDAEMYHEHDVHGVPKYGRSGAPVMSMRFSYPDLSQPSQQLAATANFAHSIATAPPEAVAEGKLWYPKVHEAVRKGVRGTGFLSGSENKHLAGSGIVAAVSPNMDWDNANIDAFKELKSLKSHHWHTILKGDGGDNHAANQAAKDITRGMSISRAPLANLRKAGRIIQGEHVDDVLNEKTAPKTNRFAHNIHEPDNPNYVTIDGRAFDTLTNRARPWEVGRGISSAGGTKGTSRYEHSENIVKGVAAGFGIDPSAAQGISWVHMKHHVERFGGRMAGPNRVGQPYFDPHTGRPAILG